MPQDPFAQYADKPTPSSGTDPFAQFADQQPTTTSQPAEPSFLSKVGSAARAVLPFGIRTLGGVMGVEGMGAGAEILGGAETIAEMVEKGTIDPHQLDPVKIGLATATGAIPFGKIVSSGATGLSALRSGLLSGGTEAAREKLSGESFDPKAIGMTAGLGALTGAGGAKLGEKFAAANTPEAKAAKTASQEVRDQARQARIQKNAANTPEAQAAARAMEKTKAAADKELLDVRDAAEKINAKRAVDVKTAAEKKLAEQAAAEEIQTAISAGGLEPQPPKGSETTVGPGGKRMTI